MYKFFELLDSDGESAGILKTSSTEEVVAEEWKHYYNETDNLGIEEFIDTMISKYPENYFERFFIDNTISC